MSRCLSLLKRYLLCAALQCPRRVPFTYSWIHHGGLFNGVSKGCTSAHLQSIERKAIPSPLQSHCAETNQAEAYSGSLLSSCWFEGLSTQKLRVALSSCVSSVAHSLCCTWPVLSNESSTARTIICELSMTYRHSIALMTARAALAILCIPSSGASVASVRSGMQRLRIWHVAKPCCSYMYYFFRASVLHCRGWISLPY